MAQPQAGRGVANTLDSCIPIQIQNVTVQRSCKSFSTWSYISVGKIKSISFWGNTVAGVHRKDLGKSDVMGL